MEPCEKRQKHVNRTTNESTFKCINKSHEVYGHTVNEDVCYQCPLRVYMHKGPSCKQPKKEVRLEDIKKPCPGCDPITDETLIRALAEKRGPEPITITPDETPDGVVPDYPAVSMQLWLYKEALLRWQRAGRPTRSDEEVEHILETHCKKCDWYDPEQRRCRGCGCRVTDGGMAVINKLRMATERCPHPAKKW